LVAEHQTDSSRHIVVAVGDFRFRLCIPTNPNRGPPAFVIPDDNSASVRLQATRAFCEWRKGRVGQLNRPPFAPTPYHRRHISRLIAIADAQTAGASARDIAFGIFFLTAACHLPVNGAGRASSARPGVCAPRRRE
jgi:hypothetical protein